MPKCFKCGEYKEDSQFSSDKSRSCGKSSKCRECTNKYVKEYIASHQLPLPPEALSKCSVCGEYKPGDMFYADKTRIGGRSSRCKECESKRAKAKTAEVFEHTCIECGSKFMASGRSKGRCRPCIGRLFSAPPAVEKRRIRAEEKLRQLIEKGTKKCKGCGQEKPLNEFSPHKNGGLDGLYYQCRECCRIKAKEYHDSMSPERKKEMHRRQTWHNRKKRYGISKEDYERVLSSQGGVCCICGVGQDKFKKSFHLDHDHDTGEFRGVLCCHCNTMLGVLEKVVRLDLVDKIGAYLHDPPARKAPAKNDDGQVVSEDVPKKSQASGE